MPQGHYFAWILGCYLEARSKAKFTVANHIDFDKDLANLNITPSVLVPGEALRSAAPHLGADVLKCATTPMSSKSFHPRFRRKIPQPAYRRNQDHRVSPQLCHSAAS